MTIHRVRDLKLKCPLCAADLKTDTTELWCENPGCAFHGLFGELIYEGKLVEGALQTDGPQRRKTKQERLNDLMGKGYQVLKARPPAPVPELPPVKPGKHTGQGKLKL